MWPFSKIPDSLYACGDFVVMNSPFVFEGIGVGIVEQRKFDDAEWWYYVHVPHEGKSWIAERSLSAYVPNERVESARGLIE